MGRRGPRPNEARELVLALYRRGEIATLEEGAIIAAVSRPTVMGWLAVAGINWRLTRQRRLLVLRRRAMLIMEGKSPKRLSKAELRRQGEKAVREFNAANASKQQ